MNSYLNKIEKLAYFYILRSSGKLCLPDFLGIGAAKAGTTWMYENLRLHPEIFVSTPKELNYFNQNFNKSLRSYTNYFKAGSNKVKGDITPGYATLSKNRIRFIKKVMPEVKLILIMRNPIEQQWAHAYHDLVKVCNVDVDDVSNEEFKEYFHKSAFFIRGGYSGLLDRWLSIFSADQFHIGYYDDIKYRPQEFLNSVFEFIRVQTISNWDEYLVKDVIIPPAGQKYASNDPGRGVKEKNHTNSFDLIPQFCKDTLKEMYSSDIDELSKRYGGSIIEEWKQIL